MKLDQNTFSRNVRESPCCKGIWAAMGVKEKYQPLYQKLILTMAEAVGFEPTCPCGQLHFECSSLQPLRYASVYKYSLLGTNHMISSQSRYDHFDTAPYLSQHQHLGKRGELMGRTSKNIKLRIPEKPHKIKGFRSGSYRVATTISSQPRYDHFDTSPCPRLPRGLD